MADSLEQEFLDQINENIGIAHKVCNIYFDQKDERSDVIQEMFYQLWKAYPKFRKDSKFSTWMYRVCFNTAITYFKKNKKEMEITEDYYQNNDSSDSNDNYEEKRDSLYKQIENLSPINKSITLLYLDGLKYEEISDITGLSVANVSVRLVRIKTDLKKINNL